MKLVNNYIELVLFFCQSIVTFIVTIYLKVTKGGKIIWQAEHVITTRKQELVMYVFSRIYGRPYIFFADPT